MLHRSNSRWFAAVQQFSFSFFSTRWSVPPCSPMMHAVNLRIMRFSLVPGPRAPQRAGTAFRGTSASRDASWRTRRHVGPTDLLAWCAYRTRHGRARTERRRRGATSAAQGKGGPSGPASFGCQQGGSWHSQSNYWFTATFSAASGNSLVAFLAAFEATCGGGVGRPVPERGLLADSEAPLPGPLSAASISSTVFA